jgi:hypothetical protein
MANLAKTARSLSDQIAPVLSGALAAVNQASDFATARQIDNFKKIIVLALKAKEAGMGPEEFRVHAELFKMNHMVFTGGSLEFAAQVSSGIETAEGKAFDVSLKAGGSVAGFALEGQAGFKTDKRESSYERSAQNLQMRVDWATVPDGMQDKMVDALAAKVMQPDFKLPLPDMKDEAESPTLKALESYLPIIKDIFKKD